MKKCLACGAERDINDGNDPACCPNCGRYYAKVEAVMATKINAVSNEGDDLEANNAKTSSKLPHEKAENTQNVRIKDENKFSLDKVKSAWSGLGETKRLLLTLLLAFAFGFLAGREHLKYEFREGMRQAAENIGNIFSKGSEPTPNKETSLKTKIVNVFREKPISAVMTNKSFVDNKYDDAVTFDIRFENKSDRDIRGFNGTIIVSDILDNVLKRLNVKITDPISAHSSITWSGTMDYNQFVASDKALKNAEFKDIVIKFEPTKILYQNGETVEFE